jgi:hypothetical protein
LVTLLYLPSMEAGGMAEAPARVVRAQGAVQAASGEVPELVVGEGLVEVAVVEVVEVTQWAAQETPLA